jgi:ferredoxin
MPLERCSLDTTTRCMLDQTIAAALRAIPGRRSADPSPAALRRLVLPADHVCTARRYPLVSQSRPEPDIRPRRDPALVPAPRTRAYHAARACPRTRLSIRGRAGVPPVPSRCGRTPGRVVFGNQMLLWWRRFYVLLTLPRSSRTSGTYRNFLCFAMPVRPDGFQDDFAPTFCASCTRCSGRCPTRYDRNRRAIERRALRWVVATVDDDDDIESLVEGTLPPEPAGTRLT